MRLTQHRLDDVQDQVAFPKVQVLPMLQLREVRDVSRGKRVFLATRLDRLEELVLRFHQLVPMKILPTVEPPESIADALAEADQEPGILWRFFPAEVAEEGVSEARSEDFVDLVSLLDDVP